MMYRHTSFLTCFGRAKTVKSIICFPTSGKHTKIFRQSRATGHSYFPLTSGRRGNNTRVVSVWKRQEQLVAYLLFPAAGDSEHRVSSLGPTALR